MVVPSTFAYEGWSNYKMKGEIFVMQKLMERGWKFPKDYAGNLEGLDWVFEKEGRTIKVRIKIGKKLNIHMKITKKSFDYLIFTDLKDCYIFPIEIVNNSDSCIFSRFCSKFKLLEDYDLTLLKSINDCGIKYSEIDFISQFFKKEEKVPK